MQQQGQRCRVPRVHALQLVHGCPSEQFLDHGDQVMDGEENSSSKRLLEAEGDGFFLGDGKGGVVWLLSGSCFVWYESEDGVWGWGSGTGVWRFIKRLELGCGGEGSRHGSDWIELGLAALSLFTTISFVLMCNYLGHFVGCMWVEPGF